MPTDTALETNGSQPFINLAVAIEALKMSTGEYLHPHDYPYSGGWIDLAKAIQEDEKVWKSAWEAIRAMSGEDEEETAAAGLAVGFVAGIIYAAKVGPDAVGEFAGQA